MFTIGGLFRDFIESNDEIAAVANKFPSRIIPFGTINPWYEEESLEEINRCIKVLKLKGFKLHPWMTGFPINSDLMDTMMREISRFDVPVIIHSGTPPWSEPLQIAELAYRFPKVKFIMAHMGITDLWKEAIDAARMCSNIWLETSGVPSLPIKTAVEEIGSDRIVFGSDSPYGGKGGHIFQLNKVRFLGLKEEDEGRILGKNLSKILNLD